MNEKQFLLAGFLLCGFIQHNIFSDDLSASNAPILSLDQQLIEIISDTQNENIQAIQELLHAGADVSAKNSDGCSVLTIASGNGYAETVTLLLAAGADVNLSNNDGATSLIIAAIAGQEKIVPILLTAGANTEAQCNGLTALLYAIETNKGPIVSLGYRIPYKNRTKIALALIAAGANVHACAAGNVTTLMLAALNNDLEVVQALIAAGVDVCAKTKSHNCSAFTFAFYNKAQYPVLQALKNAGAETFYDLLPIYFAGGCLVAYALISIYVYMNEK